MTINSILRICKNLQERNEGGGEGGGDSEDNNDLLGAEILISRSIYFS